MFVIKTITVIPAHNEEKNIAMVIQGVRKVFSHGDILVINDCSSDCTSEIAKSLGALVIDLPVRLNYGAAIQTGFKYAFRNSYDIISLLDGDGQHDPKYLQEMVEYVSERGYDLVIGSRFIKKTNYKMPRLRRLGSLFFSWLILVITGKKIYDPTSGYQVFRKRVNTMYVSEFFPGDYPDADVMLMLLLQGIKIKEFPMEMAPPGKQSMHTFLSSFYYPLKMLLSMITVVLRLEFFKKEV